MRKIAITGGLSTGKSTVLKIIKNLGFLTLSCDEIVKNLYEKDFIKNKIIEIFGKEVLKDDKIDKQRILEKIVENSYLKKRLENLFHPLVKEKIVEFLREAEKKKEKIVFIEVPLLFEVGWEYLFDEIWVISSSFNTQKKRISERFKNEIGKKLLNFQIPLQEKEKKANRIISSERSVSEIEKEIKKIIKEYLKD